MKRFLLIGLLILPLLAQADPLNNGALGTIWVLILLILGFAGLTLLLVVLAFLRPASRGLQLTQVLFLVLFSWLYLSWHRELSHLSAGSLLPGLSALLPLAVLLNGLTQAKQARRPLAGQLWAGLAVAGCTGLLWLLVRLIQLDTLWLSGPGGVGLAQLWSFALALLVNALGWLLVLALLRRQPAPAAMLWQSWWSTPAIGAGVSATFFLLDMLIVFYGEPVIIDVISLLPAMLPVAVACWLAGIMVLRFIRPLAQSQEAIIE